MTSQHAPAAHPLGVFELRNYLMLPGMRDALIELFEREFIESQEVLGSRVVGTFRNLDDANRFVWIRGFETMETRARALDGFYSGPLWQSLRNQANTTMISSDDVLQLRPVSNTRWSWADRAHVGATLVPPGLIVATTYFLRDGADEAFASIFEGDIAPALRDAGAEIVATLATEHAPNSYPRLPVREGETVFVSLTRFASPQAHTAHLQQFRVTADIDAHLIAPAQMMRLRPTPRSALR